MKLVGRRRGAVALLVAVLVLALAGAAASEVARSASTTRLESETRLALLSASAKEIEAVEWQAISEHQVSDDTRSEFAASRNRARHELRLLGERARVASAYRRYEAAVTAELAAISRGEIARALALDAEFTDRDALRLDNAVMRARLALHSSARRRPRPMPATTRLRSTGRLSARIS